MPLHELSTATRNLLLTSSTSLYCSEVCFTLPTALEEDPRTSHTLPTLRRQVQCRALIGTGCARNRVENSRICLVAPRCREQLWHPFLLMVQPLTSSIPPLPSKIFRPRELAQG